MVEMLSHGFMLRAVAAGLVMGAPLAVLSVIVVSKRLSFMGVGISHSAFGGLALGAFFGAPLSLSALVFASLVALLVGWLSRRGGVHEDVSVGIVFAASMAVGVVALGLMEGYNIDLFSYLFGSILAVFWGDLILASAVFAVVVGLVFLLFKEFMAYCFDEEWARVSGVNVDRLEDLLLVMIAVTVVVSIKLLGVVLVSALLVIPGAASFVLAGSYRTQYAWSVGLALVSVLAGLYLSYRFDIASGATIVLSATALFVLATLARKA
ncbi:MAG: metal ABC transporter permease [Candidatus Nitrospinota bacterium M3_3B_026]